MKKNCLTYTGQQTFNWESKITPIFLVKTEAVIWSPQIVSGSNCVLGQIVMLSIVIHTKSKSPNIGTRTLNIHKFTLLKHLTRTSITLIKNMWIFWGHTCCSLIKYYLRKREDESGLTPKLSYTRQKYVLVIKLLIPTFDIWIEFWGFCENNVQEYLTEK